MDSSPHVGSKGTAAGAFRVQGADIHVCNESSCVLWLSNHGKTHQRDPESAKQFFVAGCASLPLQQRGSTFLHQSSQNFFKKASQRVDLNA